MTEPNREQIEYWNGPGAQRWVTQQARLDRALEPLDAIAIERAAPARGERVLDIGCGCGASTLALAERVAAQGSVLGLDLSGPMLGRARERAAGMPQVAFTHADAARHPFSGDFDLLYSRFGVMFFDDAVSAFANLRRALRPSGRICFLCWRPPEDNPWYEIPVVAASEVLGPPPPAPPGSPTPFTLAAPERVHAVLGGAGFREIEITPHERQLVLSSVGIDEALEFAIQAGPVARRLAEMNDEARKRVRGAIERALTPYARGQVIALRASVWVVHARP